jgi:hypothetical protein
MRRWLAPLFLCLLLSGPLARAVSAAGIDPAVMSAMFEQSQKEKKGLTVFLPGHTIAIVVTAVHGSDSVEGRNQEYQRVVIRTDQIVALAFQ